MHSEKIPKNADNFFNVKTERKTLPPDKNYQNM